MLYSVGIAIVAKHSFGDVEGEPPGVGGVVRSAKPADCSIRSSYEPINNPIVSNGATSDRARFVDGGWLRITTVRRIKTGDAAILIPQESVKGPIRRIGADNRPFIVDACHF